VPRGGGFLRGPGAPATLPQWLGERDIDVYAGEFRRTGFRGALNWYRNIDRNWELLAPFAGARVTVPALYVAGDRDLVVAFPGMDQLLANLERFVPALRNTLNAPRLRPLDPAGAPERGQCRADRFPKRPAEMNAPLFGAITKAVRINTSRFPAFAGTGSRRARWRGP
jgi:hypothetical protein